MSVIHDPRTEGRTVVRLSYTLARSKHGRKARRKRFPEKSRECEHEAAHTSRLFTGRCEHGHVVDPRYPFCRVCHLTELMPAAHVDYRAEPEGDWRFWPIDTLPLDPVTISKLHKMRFMFAGELVGVPAASITRTRTGGRGLCEKAAERVKKVIWSLQRGEVA